METLITAWSHEIAIHVHFCFMNTCFKVIGTTLSRQSGAKLSHLEESSKGLETFVNELKQYYPRIQQDLEGITGMFITQFHLPSTTRLKPHQLIPILYQSLVEQYDVNPLFFSGLEDFEDRSAGIEACRYAILNLIRKLISWKPQSLPEPTVDSVVPPLALPVEALSHRSSSTNRSLSTIMRSQRSSKRSYVSHRSIDLSDDE